MVKGYIYIILNLETNFFYIGQTRVPDRRWIRHRWLLRNGTHSCKALQDAWNAYGAEKFEFRIILEVPDASALLEKERYFIHTNAESCYNAVTVSPEIQEKRRQGLLAYWSDKDHPSKGVPHTEETRQKMSEAQKGHVVSLETREKMRKMYTGRVWTEEQKEKLRKPKGRTAEHAAKFNKAIIEVTSGRRFESLKAVKEHYGISPGMLAKCLAKDAPLKKGEMKGLHFRYAEIE